jgi:hypothetical protein
MQLVASTSRRTNCLRGARFMLRLHYRFLCGGRTSDQRLKWPITVKNHELSSFVIASARTAGRLRDCVSDITLSEDCLASGDTAQASAR